MTTFNDLLDFETQIALRDAAPKMAVMPFDMAQEAVRKLAAFSEKNEAHQDLDGRKYWETTLKDLHQGGEFSVIGASKHVGRAYRLMGLYAWRNHDGFHVAWSAEQLKILKKVFKI